MGSVTASEERPPDSRHPLLGIELSRLGRAGLTDL